MKSFLRFYLLSCLLSWGIWLPLYLPHFGINVSFSIPYNHALGGLGPLVAAFLLVAKERGRKGVAELLRRMTAYRPLIYLLIALLGPFVLLLAAGGIEYMQTGLFPEWSSMGASREFPQFTLFTFFLYNLLFYGFGEEVGWAGYAIPDLQKRFSSLTTAILFTLFWALWHLPLFFYRPGYTRMDVAGIMGWTFSLLTGRVLLLWLQNRSRNSILVPAVFHATIDIAFTSNATTESISIYLGMLITFWGLATIFLLKRKSPSKKGKPVVRNELKPVA